MEVIPTLRIMGTRMALMRIMVTVMTTGILQKSTNRLSTVILILIVRQLQIFRSIMLIRTHHKFTLHLP